MKRWALYLTFSTLSSNLYAAEAPISLPKKIPKPITTRSLCEGIDKLKKSPHPDKQDLSYEMAILCNGTEPTAALNEVVSNPYDGNPAADTRTYVKDLTSIPNPAGYAVLTVLHAINIPKTPDRVIVGEEPLLPITGYQAMDGNAIELQIRTDFTTTIPRNLGSADSQFIVSQSAYRTATPASFSDQCFHEVRLYVLHPNNFDFLMAGRHLIGDGKGFYSHFGVIVAAMANPTNPNASVRITAMHIIMRDLNQDVGKIKAIFLKFVNQNVKDIYRGHQTLR